jgi:hypothetical protein
VSGTGSTSAVFLWVARFRKASVKQTLTNLWPFVPKPVRRRVAFCLNRPLVRAEDYPAVLPGLRDHMLAPARAEPGLMPFLWNDGVQKMLLSTMDFIPQQTSR